MKIAAVVLLVIGVFFTGVFTIAILADPKDMMASIAAMFFLGNVPLIAGVLLLRRSRIQKRRERIEHAERALLQLAWQNSGVLTTSTVAMETPLTVQEARELLELMVTRGVADIDVRDNGVVAYRFREFSHDANH